MVRDTTSFRPAPTCLADAVFYQIYPQSFADSDGDGIGDFAGITDHLDHLSWLGVDTVWLNPCFVSPFRDAGYDVSDYLNVAPRYGSNDDLAQLVDEAGRRGIRILLDLVAGHTSIDHPWFQASANDPDDHRFLSASVPPRSAPRRTRSGSGHGRSPFAKRERRRRAAGRRTSPSRRSGRGPSGLGRRG